MKFITLLLGAAAALSLSAAFAQDSSEEFLASCAAYEEANDTDVNCSCLDEAAQEDESLYEEYAKVEKPEDVENMSPAALEVVTACAAE